MRPNLDVAVILHNYSERLKSIQDNIRVVGHFLGENPFLDFEEITSNDIFNVICGNIKIIYSTLNELIAEDQLREKPSLSESNLIEIDSFKSVLGIYIENNEKYHPPYIRSKLIDFQNNVKAKMYASLSEEKEMLLLQNIKEIERVICFYYYLNAQNLVDEIEFQTKNLRDFYTARLTKRDPIEVVAVSKLLKQAIRQAATSADSKKVEIRFKDNIGDAKIEGRFKDLVRVFASMLNNAIKYNYTLKGGSVWVDIICLKQRTTITIAIENWGLPITQYEIESGDLFKPGYRGTFSGLKGKPGNGIGLADAKAVIEEADGTITINSVPARKEYGWDEYDKPFITTVLIELPLCFE